MDPELDAIMRSMIDHRNYCEQLGEYEWARAMDDAISSLKQHPYFRSKIRSALDEMTKLSQEFDTTPREE